ncbi:MULTISPECIES: non-ribosomal peptide synthetase [Calothrix]|uniref:Amino acid adenylation domain-containing protein n=2 Tax=Calothrix TaxID=1186 RepID=A0ABR8A6E8_9CYAN|nr:MULTISPECIES: non-ribosomal peptide synthetase [Calothrix]MBD2195449.1 amino acid adenylation domain-containing protein [Calothrix parietina FACHB-288]MBD2223111.1 amino acid adenylation domain-containing protein [Calothrix anomala FACHB-343]
MNSILPLSINQREIYIDQMMWLEGSHLNIGGTVTVQGAFDIEIFNDAINQVIRTHPSLRTRIYELEGKLFQTISPHKDAAVELIDFSSYDNSEKLADEYINQEFTQPFSFGENASLVNFQVLRTSNQRHIFYAKYHHAITDGWGIAIFFRELIRIYNQIIQDGTDNQTEKDLYLIEYLEEEAEYLESRNYPRDRDYWKQRLAGISPQVFPQIKAAGLTGDRQAIYIPREQYNRVNTLCQEIQSNAFHFILGLIAVCLTNRYNKPDLTVGLSLLNRNKKSFKDAIGLFVSTIPFRVPINSHETVHKLLDNIRSLLRQDYRHQRFPLGEMKRLAGLQLNSKEHLFEVYLSYERHDYNECFANSETSCVPLYSGQQKVPLIIYVREYAEHSDIKIDFDYNLSYLDAETVRQIVTDFQNLFTTAIERLEKPISSLVAKSQENNNYNIIQPEISLDISSDETLVSAFATTAATYPENTAVKFNKNTLTYAELNSKANRLANYLISQGVKPGTRVGICLERSENIVIAILGILKIGAAYVPIDPQSPATRLQLILEDSGICALIAEPGILSALTNKEILGFTLPSLEDELINQPDTAPEVVIKPEFPAYIIYTSGSTGTPKGCIVTHRNAIRLMRSTEPWFGFNDKDIWTLFHSFAFDFSVWELWGALLYGGKVIIVPFWLSRTPESFREFLTTERVTVLNQTPSAFYQLIRADEASVGKLALRYVIFGGEALDFPTLRPWLEKYGDKNPRLINMYGITETTVHVTYRPISLQDLTGNASVIGREIPDLQIYLLDDKLQPVTDGLPGEIYVAGAGVTSGYLNRPALTAERFLANPFGSGKIYRSGDLGRRLANGDLEYLGRIDQQVKIRGFRIELGEIQAALTSHSQVREAVIVTDEWEAENRLVAYYVPGETNPTANELRQHLKTKLPDYMIPAAYVSLDAFPLNVNGKIDNKALPAPDWNLLRVEENYIAARNADEETLCAIVASTLGIEKVGIDDNFFDIGGDSILALQVIAKAKKAGFAISARELYESATVRQLATKKAAVAVSNTNISDNQTVNLLSAADRQSLPKDAADAYPLSSLQAGMLYHTEMHPESAIFHQIFTFDLHLSYSEVAWKKAIADICDAHPVLRTSFHWTGYSTPIQIVHTQVELPLTIVDLRNLGANAQQKVAEWIESEKNRAFDITKPPLFRFQIHRLADTELSFSFSFHHVILDGWSVATLLTQLLQRYVQYLASETLPALTIPEINYKDFIAQEQQAIASGQMREFWQQYLSNLEVTTLPRLNIQKSQTTSLQRQLKRLSINIDAQLSDKIRQLAKKAGVPLKTALLAVHLRVISFITGQKEVVTGNVSNGRLETLDSQNLLGLFVNTIPFRMDLTSGTWLELIQSVFRAESDILPHRNFPLAEMQRLIDQRPLFEVGFNYVHFHVYEGLLNLPQISVQNIDIFEETDFPFLVEFCLVPGSSALQLNLIYDVEQFTAAQVEQYSQYYQAALTDIATNTHTHYHRRSLLSPTERQNLLQAANSNPANFPSGDTLISAFSKVVAEYTDKIALVWQETTLTFGELETRANRLAHYLQSQGVGTESLVGLCLERSEQLIVAILAILKAGGAYVPIDPSYPSDRIEFLLQDSGVVLLLTEQSVISQIPQSDTKIIILENIATQLENYSADALAVQILPEHPAYVIYTSGSTGKPKGCIVTHANVMRLLKATESWFAFNSEDVWTLFHSYAFDFSVWELWGALLYGGRVVVVPYWTSRSPKDFLQLLQNQQVTVLNQTPSAFRQLIQAASQEQSKLPLRYVIFGGEALELSSLQPWFELYGDAQPKLINMYGITETTVHVTYRPITQTDISANRGSVIGQPIPDLHLYILDENLEPTPVGTPGEIYIGGAGVTRGYLHQPRLSAERFIPDPFAKTLGSRLYRSGDIGRRLPDGELEYLGRADRQVKIRGFRIETGEISAVINTHPQVKEGFVLLRKFPNGDKKLVAYFTSNTESDLTMVLPEYLKSKLPDYMIPSAFVPLATIPLTVNGKLDQKALPLPNGNASSKPYIAPRTEQEATICGLMASLLNLERVGVNDDFFEIGGDSLLVTQLAIRLRQTYDSEFPLPQLFTHRTPEAIALLLGSSPKVQTTSEIRKATRQRRSVNLSDDGILVN